MYTSCPAGCTEAISALLHLTSQVALPGAADYTINLLNGTGFGLQAAQHSSLRWLVQPALHATGARLHGRAGDTLRSRAHKKTD